MPADHHRPAFCAAVSVLGSLAILLMGCGSSSSSGESLSRSEALSFVESICSKGHARRVHLFATEASNAHTHKEEEVAIVNSVAKPSAQVARELKALNAPANLKAQLNRLARTIALENKNVEARPVDVYHSQTGTYAATDELAHALGLDNCAKL